MQTNTKKTLSIYYQYLKKRKWMFIAAFASVCIAAGLEMVIPLYFRDFFDLIVADGTPVDKKAELISILLKFTAVSCTAWLFWRITEVINAYFQIDSLRDLYLMCFRYLHGHNVHFFNSTFVGSLVKKVNKFVWGFEAILNRILWDITNLLIRLVIIMFVLWQSNHMLALIMFAWVILFCVVNVFFSRYKLKFDIKRSETMTKVSGHIADTVTNQMNVKLFASLDREYSVFSKLTMKMRNIMVFTWNLSNIFHGIQGALMIALEFGMLYYAVILWEQGILSVGDFALIQAYMLTLFDKIWGFGRVIRDMYERLAESEEMTVILDQAHGIQDKENADVLKINSGTIDFANVNFFYQKDRSILKDFNLTIKGGERIAFVGPSGAGKSTIVKLLLRLHDVRGGKIMIDGQDLRDVTQDSLHELVSFVPQDPILFHRGLMENIRYGRPDATDEEVIEAAKQAHCHDFISSLPQGYDTLVGERGVKLSGGERQRVAIARAILKNAPILVLDEATSSLDSTSEALIQDALDTLMKGKTVLSIAHRLSTIMKMDRIIVMQDGDILEQGNHKELLTKEDGLYKELWDRQVGGFIG